MLYCYSYCALVLLSFYYTDWLCLRSSVIIVLETLSAVCNNYKLPRCNTNDICVFIRVFGKEINKLMLPF